jgi:hypothetical protein
MKKNIFFALTILSIAICSVFIWPFGMFNSKAGERKQTIENDVKIFIDKLSHEKVNQFQLYYFPWSATTFSSIRFDDLPKDAQFSVTGHQNLPHAFKMCSDLEKALRKFPFKKLHPRDLDMHLGCIFYENDNELLRIYISKWEPAICFNDDKEAFSLTPEIVDSLMNALPFEAYQEMKWSIDKEGLFTKEKPSADSNFMQRK